MTSICVREKLSEKISRIAKCLFLSWSRNIEKKILENAKNKFCRDLSLLMKTHISHIFSPIKLWNLSSWIIFPKHLSTFFGARKCFVWLKFTIFCSEQFFFHTLKCVKGSDSLQSFDFRSQTLRDDILEGLRNVEIKHIQRFRVFESARFAEWQLMLPATRKLTLELIIANYQSIPSSDTAITIWSSKSYSSLRSGQSWLGPSH